MDQFFIYLVEVNIAMVLFYLLYMILLRRDTFLQLRRLFFLSVIVFSLLYPFWSIPALGDLWFVPTIFGEAEGMVLIGESSMEIAVEKGSAASTVIPWERIIASVYIIITVIFLLRFIIQLLSIFRLKKRSERCSVSGIQVYQLEEDITPFSFFNRIFIHTGKHSEVEVSQILLHELTHARQWHSIDIMFIELLCLFSWWNPFVWLMKREMTINLEYLADNGVLREGVDSREYQYHLLRLTYHETAVQIVNNFNVSQLKQRIMMMNKAKSPVLQLPKYLLILPLFFLFVTANSIYAIPLPEPPPEKKTEKEGIFVNYEEYPGFPGGNAAMMKFLADNVQYPEEVKEKRIEGRVICNFVVEEDGSLSDIQVVRGVDPSLDKEALRLVKSMLKWKLGIHNGEVVRVRFTLPVVYWLHP